MNKKQLTPFQKLGEFYRPSSQIKGKVMTSAKFNHLVIQVADLFINKPVAIIEAIIKTKSNNK